MIPYSLIITMATIALGTVIAIIIVTIYFQCRKTKSNTPEKKASKPVLSPLKLNRSQYQLTPTEPPPFIIPPYRAFSSTESEPNEEESVFSRTIPMTPDPALLQAPKKPIQRAISENTMQYKTEAQRKTRSACVKAPHGKLEVNVQYLFAKAYLSVYVKQTINLPISGRMSGLTTPYVKVYLLPGTDSTRRQVVKSQCIDLSSHSMCQFENVSFQDAQSSLLKLVVLDYDRFSRTEFVAEMMISLAEVDLKEGATVCQQLMTQRRSINMDRGSLLVSLCYQPMAEQLAVIVLKAEGLPKIESSNDFYSKVYFQQNGELRQRHKTKALKGSAVFNEPFLFKVKQEDLKNVLVICELCRGDKKLGQVNLGLESSGTEIRHWNEMMLSPQKQIAESHALHD